MAAISQVACLFNNGMLINAFGTSITKARRDISRFGGYNRDM
jgi:hypothetical protein